MRRLFGHFSSNSLRDSCILTVCSLGLYWYVHSLLIPLVDGSRCGSLGPLSLSFGEPVFFQLVHGASGRVGWVHIPFGVCYLLSLISFCYYLIDRLLLQLGIHELLDRSEIAGVAISALRTVLTLSFDLDQLFGNGSRSNSSLADNLIYLDSTGSSVAINNPGRMLICYSRTPRGLFPFPFFAHDYT